MLIMHYEAFIPLVCMDGRNAADLPVYDKKKIAYNIKSVKNEVFLALR